VRQKRKFTYPSLNDTTIIIVKNTTLQFRGKTIPTGKEIILTIAGLIGTHREREH
jgi:hypothetical protein